MWFAVGSAILFTLVYVIYGVLSQPLFADEQSKILEPGYMPKTPEAPRIDSKAFSRSEGYLYSPSTGTTQRVEILTYGKGKNATYTIRTGRVTIQEHNVEGVVRKED